MRIRLINASNQFTRLRFLGREDTEVKPAVAVRAILVGGVAVAAFAKIFGGMKAAGGVNMGVAATAMTAVASTTISGSKEDQQHASE